MPFCLRAGLLLLMAIQPLVPMAADLPTDLLIARGDQNFPPYEFINAEGEPDGFNIDLLKAISRKLEMKVDIGLDAWETVREDLSQGRIHLATGMIRSVEREDEFDFSITHAGVFYCLFVRKGSPIESIDDAKGKSILVHARAYSHDWLEKRRITDRIVPVSSPQEALQMLAEGRHDCAIIERLSALALLKTLNIKTIVMAGPPLVCAPYAFAVRKGDDRLLAKLNEGIHLMHQNGVYEKLYRKWFSVVDARARQMAMVRVGLFVLAGIVGVVCAILMWSIALKKTVQRRTTALAKSERRFQELCDLLPQTVFETDEDGRLSFINRSGFEMLGFDERQVLKGVYLSDFLPGEVDIDKWAQAGDRRGKACVVSGPNIDAFPALLYAATVMPGQIHSGLRALLVDITFQKELEAQVIESQKLEALGRLAGGVAHDFNNIVTGISAYAQLIQKQPHHAAAVADGVDRILTGCGRATDLVRHFLVTAGRRQPEKQQVRLGQVAAEVFKLLQPTYGRNIIFDNTIAGDDDDAVWAEPALVFQVLMNLCVNSAQGMTESGGTLRVGLVGAAAEKREAAGIQSRQTFFVTDIGPGIDPEYIDRIFEPFFTTRGQGNGSGIGLFVVSQALADMGGSIRVESQPGQGATFIVSLPTGPSPVAVTDPEATQ